MIDAVARMLGGTETLWLADSVRRDVDARVGAVVATSGTTGTSRLVALSRDALVAAAKASRSHFGADLTWHLALPDRYVAGLMVQVRSLQAGRPVPKVGSDLADLRPLGDGDAISIVPTQLHRAVEQPDIAHRLAAFDLVLVGGAPLRQDLRARAEDFGIKVAESYGMSETCGGIVWDGVPLPGVDVRIAGDRVTIAGPTLFDGYLGDDAASRDALVADRLITRDRGHFDAGRLVIDGRVDDIVLSGGVNVDLAQVRVVLGSLAPDAVAFAVPDPEWGSRVVLAHPEGTLESWRAALSEHLPRTWLPRQHLPAQAPRTQGGKPDYQALIATMSQS